MARDRKKDNQHFNCRELHDLHYLTSLYEEQAIVRKYIINRCQTGQISYRTHSDVYTLIQKELGFPIPE